MADKESSWRTIDPVDITFLANLGDKKASAERTRAALIRKKIIIRISDAEYDDIAGMSRLLDEEGSQYTAFGNLKSIRSYEVKIWIDFPWEELQKIICAGTLSGNVWWLYYLCSFIRRTAPPSSPCRPTRNFSVRCCTLLRFFAQC